jgi:hypothetical protein
VDGRQIIEPHGRRGDIRPGQSREDAATTKRSAVQRLATSTRLNAQNKSTVI